MTFGFQFGLCACIAILTLGEGWTPAAVGLETETPAPLAFAVGLAAYPVFEFLVGRVGYGRLLSPADHRGWIRTIASGFPRAPLDRAWAWGALLIGPFTEEFITRGVLVRMLADQGAGLPVAASLGVLTCIAIHLYQGPAWIPFHVAFFVLTVILLVSPVGLWGCFGLHLAAETVPLLTLRKGIADIRAYRTMLRAAGETPAETPPP